MNEESTYFEDPAASLLDNNSEYPSDSDNEARIKDLHHTIYNQIESIFSEYNKISSIEKRERKLKFDKMFRKIDRLVSERLSLNKQLNLAKGSVAQLVDDNSRLQRENDRLSAKNSTLQTQLKEKDVRQVVDNSNAGSILTEAVDIEELDPKLFHSVEWLQDQYRGNQKELAYRRKLYKQLVDKRRDDIQVINLWKEKWKVMDKQALVQRDLIRALKRRPCDKCGAYLEADTIGELQDQLLITYNIGMKIQGGDWIETVDEDNPEKGTKVETEREAERETEVELGIHPKLVTKREMEGNNESTNKSDDRKGSSPTTIAKFTIAPVAVPPPTTMVTTMATTVARNRHDHHDSNNYIDEDLLSCADQGVIITPKSKINTRGEKKAPNSAPSTSSSISPLVANNENNNNNGRPRYGNKGINFNDIDEDLHNGKKVFRGVVFGRTQKLDESVRAINIPSTTPESHKNSKLDQWLKNKNLSSSYSAKGSPSPGRGEMSPNGDNGDKNKSRGRTTPVKRLRYTEE